MKKTFITGLVILLPLAVTIAIFIFIVNFLTQPFVGMVSNFLSELNIVNKGFLFLSPAKLVQTISQLLILLCLFLFTLALGLLARWFFITTLLSLSDKLLQRIPLVNKVYKTTQEIIKTLFETDKNSFKQVVMVPFPGDKSYVMGLVSRESPQMCSKAANKTLISVLVPTTPNPTTGFLLMCAKEDLIYLDMKPESAIKYVVSCGVITPDHPRQKTAK